jgi:hypothetical protein
MPLCVERVSVASAWFRVMIITVLVSNSVAMFSYPPRPMIPTWDIPHENHEEFGLTHMHLVFN